MSNLTERLAALTPEKREMFLRQMRKKESHDQERIPLCARTASLPLSFAQQRLWFLEQLEPGSTTYLIPSAQRLRGSVDQRALERSFQELVRRHESLCTTFKMQEGQPVQHIAEQVTIVLPMIDLTSLELQERERQALQLVTQEGQQPCDLQEGPLLRIGLVRLGEQEQVLLLTVHHIISDGWSDQVFNRELITLYQAFSQGKGSPLPELPIQYADYAQWQRGWLQGAVLEQQVAYWREALSEVQPLNLRTDYRRPSSQTHRGANAFFALSPNLSEQLRELSQKEGVTLFMLLLAAFQVLLARYSGQEDIAVGTAIANRSHKELEGLLGLFANILVLRTQVQSQQSFRLLLEQVKETALGAYGHQDVPFEHLVEVLRPERDLSRSPLFQVSFGVQQASAAAETPEGNRAETPEGNSVWSIQPMGVERATTKFDLSLSVIDAPQGLFCVMVYSTDLFVSSTIEQMLKHWERLLEEIVQRPEERIARLWGRLLSEEERASLWNLGAGPRQGEREVRSVQAGVGEQVRRSPDAVALASEGGQVSYGWLWQAGRRVARWLREEVGVQMEERIGVCVRRQEWPVVAWLGILLAGGVVVPLESGQPQERIERMVRQAGVRVVVGRRREVEEVLGAALGKQMQVGELSELIREGDRQAGWEEELPEEEVGWRERLAYVLFTSGTTGEPKGVMVSQEGIGNRIGWGVEVGRLRQEDRVLQVAGSGFDIAWWEWWGALQVGGTVVVSGEAGGGDVEGLVRWIEASGTTVVHLVPGVWEVALEQGWRKDGALRLVQYGGEASRKGLVERLWEVLGEEVEVEHFYGPTEGSISATWWEWKGRAQYEREEKGEVPIGRGIKNMGVMLVDEWGEPVPQGVRGEIVLVGVGVARGYEGRVEETAERFVPECWSGAQGGRGYRTGDMGRYTREGRLVYEGRRDGQVKVRGYRIEVGEIEGVLRRHEGVRQAVVVWRQEEGAGEGRLVGYVQVEEGWRQGEGGEEEWRRYLRGQVPEVMVPQRIVEVEQWPLTRNGKIDRRALPDPEEHVSSENEVEVEEVWSPIEEVLGHMWSEILGTVIRERDASFFERGGHSLSATRVISRIATVFQVQLPVTEMFEHPTIAEMGEVIEQAMRGGQGRELVPLERVERGNRPLALSFAQQRLWFLEQLEPGSTAYLIPNVQRLQGSVDQQALERSLQELVQRHESLRTTFKMQEGQPVQHIAEQASIILPVIDLSRLEGQEREQQALRLATQESQQPCDLQEGPLLRVGLVRLGEQDQVLLLTLHHIISDGWSNQVFNRELATLYQAFAQGQASPLPELPIQYADYAVWQRDWLQGAVLEQQLAYWKVQLSEPLPVLQLPTDRPRPPIQSYRGAHQHFDVGEVLAEGLKALGQREGVTLFMTLLAAFLVPLHYYTDQEDIVIGTDAANRDRSEIEGLIGFFVNQLVLRTNLAGNPGFRDLLRRVREVTLGAYIHQDMPFDLLVKTLQPERDLSHMPLFQVKFGLQNMPIQEPAYPTLTQANISQDAIHIEGNTAKFDLLVNMFDAKRTIQGSVEYNIDIFQQERIDRLLKHLSIIIERIVENPDIRLYELKEVLLLADKEEQQMRNKEIQKMSLQSIKKAKRRTL